VETFQSARRLSEIANELGVGASTVSSYLARV
jgi:hypothetical protein